MHDRSPSEIKTATSPQVQVKCALPKKERLARKEKILNRQSESRNKMEQYDPAAATKSITNSSKEEKVLEKGEQMKKFKKLWCAKW